MRLVGSGRSGSESGPKVLATLLSLTAFQVWATIGAVDANAASCLYDPATQTVAVQPSPSVDVGLAVEGDGADLDQEMSDGSILMRDEGGYTSCGSASNTNTSTIVVLGTTASESFTLDDFTGDRFATSIAWSIDLGSGGGDSFVIDASEDTDDQVVLTDTGFTLNGGGGDVLGAEFRQVLGNDGNDTIDGSALTAGSNLSGLGGLDTLIGGVAADVITGGDGNDTLVGGPGNDVLDGGGGIDRLHGGDGSDTCVLDDLRLPCDPSINVDPMSVGAKGSLTLAGGGWYPENGVVELSFDPSGDGPATPLTAVTPDAGDWSIRADVVAPSSGGTYVISACQPCSDGLAERETQTFIVQAPAPSSTVPPQPGEPALSLAPRSIQAGGSVVVTGHNWIQLTAR